MSAFNNCLGKSLTRQTWVCVEVGYLVTSGEWITHLTGLTTLKSLFLLVPNTSIFGNFIERHWLNDTLILSVVRIWLSLMLVNMIIFMM